MNSPSPTYAPREWIPARKSFENEPSILVSQLPALRRQVEAAQQPHRVALTGIGASHAATATPLYYMRELGIDAERYLPSEIPPGREPLADTIVLASQSGRSAEVVALARRLTRTRRLALTNYRPSPLAEICDQEINFGDHPDSSVSLHSFASTILTLLLLAEHWSGVRGGDWNMAIERAVQGLAEAEGLLTEASRRASRHAVTDVVASQPLMSVAEETCLMMREGPRIASAAMETRLYLHGPMDCAGDTAHIILGGERESLLADQLAERADDIVFITGSDGPAPTTRKALTIRMPSPCADYPANILAAVFLAQGIVIGASEERGIDMDAAAFRRLDTKVTQVPR